MSEDSFPSTPHNARALTESEWEQLGSIIGSGVIGTSSDTAVAYADSSGRQVKIRAGKTAFFGGQIWLSGSTETIKAFDTNTSGSTRIDRLVWRLDRSTYTLRTVIVKGAPGAGVPALTRQTGSSGVYEWPLLQVSLANNFTTIAPADVLYEAWVIRDVPMASVRQTSTQPLPYGVGTLVNFDTDVTDRWGFHSTTAETYKIIPTVAGLYAAIGWCGITDGNSSLGFHSIYICRNGSSTDTYGGAQITPIAGVPTRMQASAAVLVCNGTSDSISLGVMNAVSSGGLYTEIGTASAAKPGLSVWKIGEA